MKALGNRRGCLGTALVLLVSLLSVTGAFGSSGRAELAFNSTGDCVGDSWNLTVTALGSPKTELRLQGISNGKNWELPFTTDDGGYFKLSGIFASDAAGKHTLHVVDGYGATPDIHFEVMKCDVYVMSGGNAAGDRAVLDTLIARGLTPILGVESWQWDGTQRKLQPFATVVLLNNYNWASPDMPAAGQKVLLEYVSKGGGLVTGEWLIWNITEDGKGNTLSPMIPAIERSYGDESFATYVQAQEDPIINKGLPHSFSFALNYIDGSQSFLEGKPGSTVFYDRGLIGWNYLAGRVLGFSTLLSEIELADSNYARLFVNAVEWAASAPHRIDFSMADHGGMSVRSKGTSGTARIGYAAIHPDSNSATPSGLAILGLRQNNVLVSETSVPASVLIESGRIYAEVNGRVNTGLAIANPGNEPAVISFFFTDSTGDFGGGSTTIPANGQIAAFLNQSPFNGPSLMNGSFTLNSSAPVAVFALRGLINERSEFLTATLPVADLRVPPTQGTAVLPHFAEGKGWTTEIALVNPTNTTLYGRVEFRDQLGELASVILNDEPPAIFPVMRYAIPARSSQTLHTSGETTFLVTGSIRVVPELDTLTPAGVAILSLRNKGITIAEAGIPSVSAGSTFRLYAETAGDFVHGDRGSIDTGLAVANNAPAPASVAFDLHSLDGSSMGMTGTLSIPGHGQAAIFLRQIPGFESLPAEFQGVVRVSSEASLSVVGVRCRYNERSDLLFTVIPAVNEATEPSTAPLYFPHIVDSGGYTTQFVLLRGQTGPASSGTIRLFSQSGGALTLELD